jgi:hypothetical protein
MLGAMRKRRKVVLGLAAAALVLTGHVGWRAFAPPRHRITADSIRAIRGGMTLAEVETLLGAPPGDYSTTGKGVVGRDASPLPTWYYKSWSADDAGVTVWFDNEGWVVMKEVAIWAPPVSWLDRVRSWLGW